MTIAQALRYPFAGHGWFRRLLTLALLQLIPVIGQMLLIGYGHEVVRSIYRGQTDLPAIRPAPMLKDGLRFLLTGLLYTAPVLGIVPMLLFVSTTGSANALTLLFSLVFMMVVAPMLRRLPIRNRRARLLIRGAVFTVPVLVITATIVNLVASQTNAVSTAVNLNGGGILLFVVMTLFALLIVIGLHVGAVRYAVEDKGLFDATGNARLLLRYRATSARLILNVLMLILITVVVTGAGLVLLVIPGLFALVVFSLAIWYLFAQYGLVIGVGYHPL